MNDSNSNRSAELAAAIDQYCDDCLQRVEPFVSKYLRGTAAWRLNSAAFGWDLLRVPLNIAWAPFWLLLQLVAWLFAKGKLVRVCEMLRSVPAGMKTGVQKKLAKAIDEELLEIAPHQPDPLLDYMARTAGVDEQAWHDALENNLAQSKSYQFQSRMFGARTAIAELSSGVGMTALGAVMFKQFTPGAIGGGAALATWWSYNNAVSGFWAGERLGGLWYGWFPPDTDWTTRVSATVVLMVILALVASFSGFITDPLQSLLGLHQRRLRKLVEQLRNELKTELLGDAQTREQYLARLADVADWIAMATSKAT